MISVFVDKHLQYPDNEFHFSPHEQYPEYGLVDISARPNPVYAAVRECFAQAGLDREHLGRPEWNPLGAFIKPGCQVFILCNFVYHRRPLESKRVFQAKCTHASVIRALVDYVLIAVGASGKVLLGNAPLQSCRWGAVLEETGADTVLEFYRGRHLPVQARDLRLYVTERSWLGSTTHTETKPLRGNAVVIDLGLESLLAQLYSPRRPEPRFRVADYDAEETEGSHTASTHQYIVHQDVLQSDAIICVPKLKTHQKVGVTCSLKGFVGIAGRKDCLAHHRFGNPAHGGDEYPNSGACWEAISRFYDWVQRPRAQGLTKASLQVADRSLKRMLRLLGVIQAGAWFGNDTAWRMALDLARIALYADKSGRMSDARQRTVLSLVDGVVGGEGEGPLSPTAVRSGSLVFSDDVALADWSACRLMGYDPASIPLVREAFRPMRYPVANESIGDLNAVSNRPGDAAELGPALGRPFRPPAGWLGRVEMRGTSQL